MVDAGGVEAELFHGVFFIADEHGIGFVGFLELFREAGLAHGAPEFQQAVAAAGEVEQVFDIADAFFEAGGAVLAHGEHENEEGQEDGHEGGILGHVGRGACRALFLRYLGFAHRHIPLGQVLSEPISVTRARSMIMISTWSLAARPDSSS